VSFLETVAESDASGDLATLYAEDIEHDGYVANATRAFGHRPELMRAWEALNKTIKGRMDLRRYELATLAAAKAIRSSYCGLAHGSVLASKFFIAEQVASIATDHHSAGLDEAEVALMDFSAKVATAAADITDADIDGLRGHGFGDQDIFDIASAAAARCFFSKMLDATGALPDREFRDELEPDLRRALTFGRPIAD
jgi:uncharacterized peroxidase-related enzyme